MILSFAVLFLAGTVLCAINPSYFVPYSNISISLDQLRNGGVEIGADSLSRVDWIRLHFNPQKTRLYPGDKLKISSLEDPGYFQFLDAESLEEWEFSSAFFNGNRVKVMLIEDENVGLSVNKGLSWLVVDSIQYAVSPGFGTLSLCYLNDRRKLSHDNRTARIMPVGCTGWLIDDRHKCFLSAGHCYDEEEKLVIQFNVPLSQDNGMVRHPHPNDQYPVQRRSIQYGQTVGDDWMYFGTFRNSNTRKTPYQVQKSFFNIARRKGIGQSEQEDDREQRVFLSRTRRFPKLESGSNITITGYGLTSAPYIMRSQVQQTSYGPYVGVVGDLANYEIKYRVDTTPGNSGSAILHDKSGLAIGIHTLGGCSSNGDSNAGTSILTPRLQRALHFPKGVCRLSSW